MSQGIIRRRLKSRQKVCLPRLSDPAKDGILQAPALLMMADRGQLQLSRRCGSARLPFPIPGSWFCRATGSPLRMPTSAFTNVLAFIKEARDRAWPLAATRTNDESVSRRRCACLPSCKPMVPPLQRGLFCSRRGERPSSSAGPQETYATGLLQRIHYNFSLD
jgi:hypothetical protein